MERNKQRTRTSVVVFGVFMASLLVLSLFTGPILNYSQNLAAQRQVEAANRPTAVPTFLPPVSVSDVTFDRVALQGSGLFTVAVPAPPAWDTIESSYDTFANRARLVMRNAQEVIETAIEQPTTIDLSAPDALEQLYTEQTLGASWRSYSSWEETQRLPLNRDGRDILQMDFALTYQNRNFVARHAAWTDGTYVYSVRVITPQNATELLNFLLDGVVERFDTVDALITSPLAWNALYDASANHIIRYPQGWQATVSGVALPASIEAQGVALRVEAIADATISAEADAEAFALGLPQVTEVLSVVPTERGDLSGFTVAYSTRTPDGEIGSGGVVLLNGEGKLHVANLRVSNLSFDLNAPGDDLGAAQYANILATFIPITGVEYAANAAGSSAPLIPTVPAAQ
ncbi:MAG: hypothetical protein ACOYL5_11390 [Phototrophicaceae bacterium]|jgi:hypothetical protein